MNATCTLFKFNFSLDCFVKWTASITSQYGKRADNKKQKINMYNVGKVFLMASQLFNTAFLTSLCCLHIKFGHKALIGSWSVFSCLSEKSEPNRVRMVRSFQPWNVEIVPIVSNSGDSIPTVFFGVEVQFSFSNNCWWTLKFHPKIWEKGMDLSLKRIVETIQQKEYLKLSMTSTSKNITFCIK